jgi:hypothetical protein
MQSVIYLFLGSLLYPYAKGCVPGDRHELDASHIETQLKLLGARRQSARPTGKTALTNVRIFDGWKISEPRTVVFNGDSITFDSTNMQAIIDGKGGILLPGLIDSHIHPSALSSLETLSSYGVTTAMNMGCSNYSLAQPSVTKSD